MTLILNQDKQRPVPIEKQIMLIFALNKGILDNLSTEEIKYFKEKFYPFVLAQNPNLVADLRKTKAATTEVKDKLVQLIKDYFERQGSRPEPKDS